MHEDVQYMHVIYMCMCMDAHVWLAGCTLYQQMVHA